jgi:DNA polymerase IV
LQSRPPRASGAPRAARRARSIISRTLSIAHIDCDAFYATVEKRERPDLADRPVIIGGGSRGVVLACCYVARLYGVRSAMPMFKALAACPDAVVIRPNMAKYREVGRAVRVEMPRLTPVVEPLSIDEAFRDLGGTQALHGACPAQLLATLARRVEDLLAITVSIGLSDNKFLAKLASDLDKPRGFAVLSRGDASAFLADKPVALLWGVGTAMQRRLTSDGSRPAMAGSARGSPVSRAVRTTAPSMPTPRRIRSRRRTRSRTTKPTRMCWRTRSGRCASKSRRA